MNKFENNKLLSSKEISIDFKGKRTPLQIINEINRDLDSMSRNLFPSTNNNKSSFPTSFLTDNNNYFNDNFNFNDFSYFSSPIPKAENNYCQTEGNFISTGSCFNDDDDLESRNFRSTYTNGRNFMKSRNFAELYPSYQNTMIYKNSNNNNRYNQRYALTERNLGDSVKEENEDKKEKNFFERDYMNRKVLPFQRYYDDNIKKSIDILLGKDE